MLQVAPETVLGYLKTDLKGFPKWTRGVWLTKTMTNDCHMIGTPAGTFVTPSIRRLPEYFQLELLGELVTSPGERYARLGHRLVYSKRVSQPFGVAVGTDLKLGDREALAVRDFARDTRPKMLMLQQSQLRRGCQQLMVHPMQQLSAPSAAPDGTDKSGDASSSSRPDAMMPQSAAG